MTQGFDEWINDPQTEDCPSLYQAFRAGAASRQAEIDALRGGIEAVIREAQNLDYREIIGMLRFVLNSSETTENSEP